MEPKNLFSSGSGSATGNPRNKTALKPGFSLIGWVRLGNSGEDLTGFKGKTFPVSHQELAKHDTPDDLWMAVRGKVYNVTRYLDYHPGGIEQLMRGAGKDATNLFDEYHAFVNITQLLAKCYVGPLRNTATLNLKDSSSLAPPTTSAMKLPPLSPIIEGFASPVPAQQLDVIIPRFDWIQKTLNLSIYFYTKGSNSNVGLSIAPICDKEIEATIYIGSTINTYRITFLQAVKWPPVTKINYETGKIEITFDKEAPELWTSFGVYERTMTKDDTIYNNYEILQREFFNHDSFEMIVKPKKEQIIILPIGCHLNLKVNLLETDTIRSYTPVPTRYSRHGAITMPSNILFLIKSYNDGKLSKYLAKECSNELLKISQPKGNLDLTALKDHTSFSMLSAGSGITPMISLLDYLLERTTNKVETINLYYFNKTESDIWLRKEFDEIAKRDQRFHAKHILSDESRTGNETGRITKELVDEVAKSSTFVFVCGPSIFNDIALGFLREQQDVKWHCFQG